MLRTLTVAALLLLLAPGAEAAPRPAPDLATLATTEPAAYAAYRGHRHRRVHRHRRYHAGARPWWLVTHPRWPSCYDRYPFYCAAPDHSRHVVRHRGHHGAVVRVRG